MGLPATLAPSPKAFASFVLPMLVPVVAMLLSFGGGLNASTALLLLVFATVLLGLYLSSHHALMETLASGHENTLLLEKLRVTEKSLTSALAQQQQIFETTAVGIAFVSYGMVVKCNKRFAEILGYAVDEIAGHPVAVWLDAKQDFLRPGGHAHTFLTRGKNYYCELNLRRKDGKEIWALSDSRAIDPANPQDGIIIGLGDISERKIAEAALARAKERLDLAMQSSALSVWEWDARRGTVYVDAAQAQMTGEEPRERYLTPEEIVPMVHPDDREALRQAQNDCIRGSRQQYHIEYRLKTAGGDWVWVLSRGRVVERAADGRALRMAGTNVDVTQRKRADAELLAALQRERELSDMKSKFVSIASHELRTPLATILSSSELLQHYADKISAEDRVKMLQAIQAAVKRMNNLMEDVLIVGRAQAGTLQFEPKLLDPRELCQKVLEEMRAGAASGHELRFEQKFERDSVYLDEKLLRYILGNLLSNAVKFSAPGSVVSLLLEEREAQAVIEVADQGIGIPPEDQARVFDSFHRAGNVDGRQGTGLGLAIVKKAVELHGGSISMDSKVDVGTRVSVRLPLTQTSTARAA